MFYFGTSFSISERASGTKKLSCLFDSTDAIRLRKTKQKMFNLENSTNARREESGFPLWEIYLNFHFLLEISTHLGGDSKLDQHLSN